MSKKISNFASVNDKQLIAVLNAKVAQLTVALDEAERNGSSAQLHQFEQLLSKQKEEDRAYYEHKMEEERLRHAEELAVERAHHSQEIKDLKESQKQEIQNLKQDFRNQMRELKEELKISQRLASARELTASEMKALAKFRQAEKYKRTAEQRRLLNRRDHEEDRQKEKDEWDGDGSGSASISSPQSQTDQPSAGQPETAPSKKPIRKRTDCRKNVPYTEDPKTITLQEYFTLPFKAQFVMREGKVDTWLMRELVRIPEHYEERFYEVARYRTEDGEFHSTRSRQISGCFLDDNLIGYVLGEHFVYNKPYRQICLQLKELGLSISDSTLGRQVHKVIKYFIGKMKGVWEAVLRTADYWMVDETPH